MTPNIIYISYHNQDYHFVLPFVRDLVSNGIFVCLDRFAIHPLEESWSDRIQDHIQNADAAIVIVSQAYLESTYCNNELQWVRARQIPIYAIFIDDVSLHKIQHHTQNFDWFDFKQHQNDDDYRTTLGKFIQKIAEGTNLRSNPSAETRYLVQSICETELFLFNTPFQQSALHYQHATHGKNDDVRPLGHALDLFLRNGFYALQMNNGIAYEETNQELTITNLIEWLKVRSQLVLTGEAGCGKTFIARHLMLYALHSRLHYGSSQPLPLWLNAAAWHPDQSLDAVLQSSFRVDVSETPVILFIDDIDTLTPWQMDDVLQWHTETDCTLVATARNSDNLRLSLAALTIPALSDKMLYHVSKSYLSPPDAKAFVATIQKNCLDVYNPAIYQRLDYVGWQMLLFQSSRNNTSHHPRELIKEVVPTLWAKTDANKLGGFTVEQLEAALQLMAFTIVSENKGDYTAKNELLESSGNPGLVAIALHLGILDEIHGHIRFRSKAVQDYYAGLMLLQDGLYTRLSYPDFDVNGNYSPTHWDDVIRQTLYTLPPKAYIANIDMITDVDPFLAADLLQYTHNAPDFLQQQVVLKLLHSEHNPYPRRAIRQAFAQLPNPALIKKTLIEVQRHDDSDIRQLAFSVLLEQVTDVPETVLEQIHQIDRAFPDAISDILESCDYTDLLCILILLTTHPQVRIRQNAVWVLGQLQDRAALPALTATTGDDNKSVVIESVRALAHFGHHALPVLLHAANQASTAELAEVQHALIKLQRPITGFLITLLKGSEAPIATELIQLLVDIEDEMLGKIIINTLPDDIRATLPKEVTDTKIRSDEETDTVKQLLDFISNQMQTLRNHEAFTDFVDLLAKRQVSGAKAQNLEHLKERIRGGKPHKHVEAPRNRITGEESPQSSPIPQHVIEALQCDEWEVRLQAITQLADYDGRQTLPYLLEASKDMECQVRIAALEALGRLKSFPVALDALVNALDDNDYLVLDALTDILKQCGSGILYNVLAKLSSANANTLAAAIEVLGFIGNDSIVPQLIPFLNDTRPPWLSERTLRDITAQALINIDTPASIQAVHDADYVAKPSTETVILPDNESTPQPTRQKGQFTPAEKITLALQALRGNDWQQSQKAARYIREYAKRLRGTADLDVIKPLQEALTDENWVVRWTATEALAWLRYPATEQQIAILLADENWIVRVAAIRALVELNAHDSASRIAQLIQDSQDAVREAVVEAVGFLKNRSALPVLTQAIDDNNAFVRLAALQSIIALIGAEAAPLIVHKLSDTNSHIRWATIQHLARYPHEISLDYFAAALNDCNGPDWEKKTISDYAVDALKKVDSPASKALLERWKQAE